MNNPSYKWAFWVTWEWMLILLALWSTTLTPWLIPLALLVIGSRQHALGVLGHEVVHRTVGVSDRVGNCLAMWPIFSSVEGYRKFHEPHHLYLGSARDPEVLLKSRFAYNHTGWLPLVLLRNCVGGAIPEAVNVIRLTFGPTSRERLLHAGGLFVLLYLVAGIPGLLMWVGALFTTFWLFHHPRARAEHSRDTEGVMQTPQNKPTWWERIYRPHNIWKHKGHHARWNLSCWDLK